MVKIVWQTYSNLFRSQAAKDTYVVLMGNLLNAGLGFVSIVVLSRWLGPGNFGLFGASMALMGMVASLSDAGGSVGLVKFASLHIVNSEKEMSERIYSIFFRIRILVGSLVFVGGLLLARPLAELVFHKPELTLPFRIAFFGIIGILFLGFLNAVLIANRFFGRNVIVNFVYGVGKVLGVFGLLLCHKLNLISVLSVYSTLPLLLFFMGVIILPTGMFRPFQFKFDIALFKKVFNFSKWVFLWTMAVMVYLRLDVFMLTALGKSEEVGYYYAAHKLSSFFPLIMGALTTVLLPRVTALKEKGKFKDYIHRVVILAPFFSLLAIIAFVFAKWMVPLLFGTQYTRSILPFQILILGYISVAVMVPASMIFYTLDMPQIIFFITFIQLIVNAVMNLLLIPPFEAIGASIAFVGARVVGAIMVFYFIKKHVYD